MTDEEAIEVLKRWINNWEYIKPIEELSVELDYFDYNVYKILLNLIEKKDKVIKSMAKELTNLIDEDVDTIIKRFEEEK